MTANQRRKVDQTVCVSSDSERREKKKKNTFTQILPMEEDQEVDACSANEKNVCKLTTKLF